MATANGTMDVEETLRKIEVQLAPLTETKAVRGSRVSTNKILLDRSEPIIRAARAKGHGWRQISKALESAGVFVSRTSLARHFEEEKKPSASSASSGSKKKTRKKRPGLAQAQIPDWNIRQTNGARHEQHEEQRTGTLEEDTALAETESRPTSPTPHAAQSRRRKV